MIIVLKRSGVLDVTDKSNPETVFAIRELVTRWFPEAADSSELQVEVVVGEVDVPESGVQLHAVVEARYPVGSQASV